MEFNRTLLINAAIAILICLVLFLSSGSELMTRLEYLSNDICYRVRGLQSAEQPIVIIEITDEDISKIGRWPWKRSWHAAIAKVLTDLGAKAIYFDVIFSEPSDEENDYLLEESIKLSKKVYLPYVFPPSDKFRITDALLPIKRFSSEAKGMGAMNIYPDKDGVVRRLPLIFKGEGGTYPHIALKMFMDFQGLRIKEIVKDAIVLSGGNNTVEVPIVDKRFLVVNWKGRWKETFRHYSFLDVLAAYQDKINGKEPGIDIGWIKNSVCLVGVTAFGLYDIKPIPLEPEYPGIGIIANALYTLLERSFVNPVPNMVNILTLVLMALIPVIVVRGANPFKETAFLVLAGVVYFAFGFYLFTSGIKINIFLPIITLCINGIAVGTYSFVYAVAEKQRLFDIAVTDGLTGLCNIRHFKVLLESEIKMANAGMAKGFVLVLSDIDHFKKFNDTYGHQVGDLVLKEVAKSMTGSVRASDIVARYGGEEMIILLKSVPMDFGFDITEKVRSNIDDHRFTDGNNTYHVTSSFGVASFKPDDTVDTIIKRADEGLYKAKEEGRNCVCTIEDFIPKPIAPKTGRRKSDKA